MEVIDGANFGGNAGFKRPKLLYKIPLSLIL